MIAKMTHWIPPEKRLTDNQDLGTQVVRVDRKCAQGTETVYNFYAAQKESAEDDLAAGKLKV